jgi:hypothetical protein
VLNAVVPTGASVQTFSAAALTLVAQVALRGLMMVCVISLIMGTSRWREGQVDALLDFRGVLSLGLFSVFACLLLRVYIVVLASDEKRDDVRASSPPATARHARVDARPRRSIQP